MNKTAKLRLFFGLEIPESIKQRLLSIQQPVAGARWQHADQLHLTLAFLGSVEAQQLSDICQAARNLPVKPFDLTVAGVGCFGHPDCPKNLWAGVQPVAELARLHGALNQRLAASGFGPEKRSFKPHITLARFKKAPGSVADLLRDPDTLVAGSFTVNRIALFESTQGRYGSVYRVLEWFPLIAS
ncbi:RNA 2',3'-cyclic phosphodiesterase [Marinobacter vulgaris]|uniref:RNA 2',3'-cyclic phosphodiesterase n=1 Tax=Marinobacter vulgaris TaxID=1928331 RepID=UPI001D0DACCF|nr:RNA 2',3'-cyclic phosphodiesterase [Marinobacter vulgaris]